MPQLQHLIDNAQEVWALEVKPAYRFDLLSEDPLKMHKAKFVDYLRAKAEATYRIEKRTKSHEDALALVAAQSKELVDAWKAAARSKALSNPRTP